MADEFQLGSTGNWCDTSRNRFDTTSSSQSSISATLSNNKKLTFEWPTEMSEINPRSSMDSSSVFPFSKLQERDANLQVMGLGLSSQGMDWNHSLLEKAMLQEDANFQQEAGGASSQDQRTGQKIYSDCAENSSVMNDFKQINRGFSLDQPEYSSQVSSNDTGGTISQGLTTSFQMESAAYGLLLSDNQPHQSTYENQAMNYPGPYPTIYGATNGELFPSWSKIFPFLRASAPKQPPSGHLHFTNNTPFWNASAAAIDDVRPSFFPSLQPQLPTPPFHEKPKITMETRDVGMITKKNTTETSNKRSRSETPSPLPALKVRKEKMGDRVTALQQLVSPFGKTDTASVLSEAIEYIKHLHDQVNVLSTPYLKSGVPLQHQQNSDKFNDPDQWQAQDLKSRGLCLVPVSSTIPVTHETTTDFWNPTFGGTFR
ncbi:transcription factor bHLH123-like isoform X2 [Olea europaea var. sylvestris]|uniref:transcription factor bHLH123-like isoform X2 n=1 Tax=Olea europaea var. sylvestris TaxID=158386 RepID=UPI000C1CE398|nr:transcription factor bHLH123-like isoform X2 [Olea europaea var. sylvestris]